MSQLGMGGRPAAERAGGSAHNVTVLLPESWVFRAARGAALRAEILRSAQVALRAEHSRCARSEDSALHEVTLRAEILRSAQVALRAEDFARAGEGAQRPGRSL